MTTQSFALRKAAILVSSLDTATADAILEQMPAEQAGLVRHALVALGEIPPDEERDVIDEFLHNRPRAGIETAQRYLQGQLERRLPLDRDTLELSRDIDSHEPPFGFLHDIAGAKLAPILAGERPQTIALVISHLPAARAAEALAAIEPAVQAEVLKRLADLDEADPQMLREVERGLESKVREQAQAEKRRAVGRAAVAGILQAAAPDLRQGILANLDESELGFTAHVTPARLHFDDLARLDDDELSSILRTAEPQLLALALAGGRPEFASRALALLEKGASTAIQHDIDNLGPTRLGDIEEAQHQLAELAAGLRSASSPGASSLDARADRMAGRIVAPRNRRKELAP